MKKLALLLLALAFPLAAQDSPKTITATAMPVATFEELAAAPPPPESHAVRVHRHARRIVAPAVGPEVVTQPATLAPPALGLSFRDEAEPSSIYPADASGAVGKARVVGVNNKSIWLHDRDGSSGSWAYLGSFFSTTGTFDPRVVYDPQADRWIVAALRDNGPPTYLNAKFLLAVSDTNNPMGSWHRYSIPGDPIKMENFDFTELALTRDNILVTVNVYWGEAQEGAEVFVIPKSAAYASVTTLPITARGTDQFSQYLTPVGVQDSNDASNWYAVVNGTKIDAYDATTGARVASYDLTIDPMRYCCGAGKQLGSSQMMDVGWPGMHYAVIRNRALWGVENRTPGPNAPMGVLAFKIDLNTSAATIWQIQSNDTAYAFPSIAVNKFGGAVVAFSAFNAGMYPSAAFSYIAPDGQWSSPSLLKSGEGPYTVVRWGDFTTTVVDPVDDATFWTTQVIALAPSPYPTWSTWWTQIPIASGVLKHHAAHH